MADLTIAERINLSYKLAFLIQGTSNTEDALGRKWYEEPFEWSPILIAEDVWINTVPFAAVGEGPAKQAANPTIIAAVDMRLTKKAGYNERIWAAHNVYNDESSAILKDFLIPQKFGPGWTARIYEDDGAGNKGTEISTTEGAWIFSYKTGLLILGAGHTAANEGWTEPIHLVGYRYIGETVKNIAGAAIDLDGAYDNGQKITIDKGPVEIDATASTDPPLLLNNLNAAPSTNLSAGSLAIVNNRLFSYDGTRTKWLSAQRTTPIFGKRSANGEYLQLFGGDFSGTDKTGFICNYDCTIVGITANSDGGNNTKTIRIRKNGAVANLASFSLIAGKYSNLSADIDLDAGDILQVFADPAGTPVRNISVQIEVAIKI